MGLLHKVKRRLPILGAGGNVPAPSTPAQPEALPPNPAQAAPRRDDDEVQAEIQHLVESNAVVLFMKGTPAQPMCGFSANAARILQSYEVPLAHVDVLAAPEMRRGVKTFSDWPTLPQVYVGGEFIGGSDILVQLHESGELGTTIAKAQAVHTDPAR